MELYFYTHLETPFHRKRVRDLLDGKLIAYLLTKSVDWLYEKEWRYITSHFACQRDATLEPDYVEAGSFVKVKEVYLGVKFNALMSQNFFCMECATEAVLKIVIRYLTYSVEVME